MAAARDTTQQVVEEKLFAEAQHHENVHNVQHDAFNRRHSLTPGDVPTERRRSSIQSMKKSFEATNMQMVFPVQGHLEMTDDFSPGNSIDDIAVSWYVWLVAATASIAGSLFGYDTGIISAVLVYLGNDLGGHPTSAADKEAITSLCSGGAFIGAIIAGLTADKYGRKIAIYVGCVLFTIGAILQGAAYSLAQMIIGRLVVGFGVGSAAMVVPLYIAEVSEFGSQEHTSGMSAPRCNARAPALIIRKRWYNQALADKLDRSHQQRSVAGSSDSIT